MLKLNNPRVARHFTAAVEKDRNVTVPGIYSGPLSGIGIAAARKMVADGDDQIKPIPGKEAPDDLVDEPEDGDNKNQSIATSELPKALGNAPEPTKEAVSK